MSVRAQQIAVVLAAALACAPGILHAQAVSPSPDTGKLADVSLADYRAHLQALEGLTQSCAKARDAETCDPALVGDDNRVPWGASQKRIVRFGWLRVLFARAQEPDAAVNAQGGDSVLKPGPNVKSDVRTTSQLLDDAQVRLAFDLAQTDQPASSESSHTNERAVLQQVLAGSEFRHLKPADGKETLIEKINHWINKFFEGVGKLQVRAAWVGRALIWGFIIAVGVVLAWALLQWERRWRVRLIPDTEAPAPGAASARDWQLWLSDARAAAGHRQWREAIHFLYWAAISRLESKKLWPADRARTPREYLALVAGDDPRKSDLGALTQEFEWTWYGGRSAAEADYHRADQLAQTLFEAGSRQSQTQQSEPGAAR